MQQYTFPNKGASVWALMKENDDKEKKVKAEAILEVLKPGQDRPKILRESGIFFLFPPPMASTWQSHREPETEEPAHSGSRLRGRSGGGHQHLGEPGE